MEIKQNLRDRIQSTGGGIMIYPDKSADTQRKVYVGEFKLSYPEETMADPFNQSGDSHRIKMNMKQTQYWEAGAAFITAVRNNSFLLIVETEDGEIVESCRIYHSNNAQRDTLYVRTEKKRRYGKDAQVITIEWPEDIEPESIGSQYIYLQDSEKKRYCFLTDVITPLDNMKKQMDQYVYEIPDGASASDYRIGVHELLMQKYDIVN